MRNLESYHIPEPILEACRRLGVTTLAEFMQKPEKAFIETLSPTEMMLLYDLVDEYGLRWGSAEGRMNIRGYCMNKDQAFCYGMIYSTLEEDMAKWQEAEREFAEHPERFEDLTKYDEHGRPYIEDEYDRYVMPDKTYDNFLLGVSFADEPLLFWGAVPVYMLLNARKFVKPIQ